MDFILNFNRFLTSQNSYWHLSNMMKFITPYLPVNTVNR